MKETNIFHSRPLQTLHDYVAIDDPKPDERGEGESLDVSLPLRFCPVFYRNISDQDCLLRFWLCRVPSHSCLLLSQSSFNSTWASDVDS